MYQTRKKPVKHARCGVTGVRLQGVSVGGRPSIAPREARAAANSVCALRLRTDTPPPNALSQLPARRPSETSNKRLSRKNKTVHRIYGGCLSHAVVKERIIRAFLIEEQKIVKKVRARAEAALALL